MPIKIRVIGIGAGHPEQITIQAINAINNTDVMFITDKGADKDELARFRREIIGRYAPDKRFRIVSIPDPVRDRNPGDYEAAVESWHRQRAALYDSLFKEHLKRPGDTGAFLVWGDPSLYDSTIRILETLNVDFEVIPGITAIQSLTASHRIPLNQIGAPVQITTGRLLAGASPTMDTVVMLDGECAFNTIADEETEIYWGAYLGTADEILLKGKLTNLKHTIQQTRDAQRQQKGWIMDTYLLRKPRSTRE